MYTYRGGIDVDGWVQWGSGLIQGQIHSIGQFKDEELEAGVTYYNYNQVSIHASIVIGKGKRITKSFLKEIFRYPFSVLGVTTIIASVRSTNISSISFLTKLGFTLEATLKGVAIGGNDLFYYTINKHHCKWYKEN